MFPVLVTIGSFTLHTYGVFLAGAFASALAYAVASAARRGLDTDGIFNLFLLIVFAAIAGSRLLYVLFTPAYYFEHPLEALRIWEGGLVFHGGLLLAVPAVWVYLRRSRLPVWETADIAAPAIALGQSVGRLGCLAAGCCFGSPSSASWAVTFTHPEALAPKGLPLHPTQLYASLSAGLIFLFLHFYNRQDHAPGRAFCLYLILASAARLLEDAFRGSSTRLFFLPELTAVQGIALLIMPAAAFLYHRLGRKGPYPAP